MKTEVTQVRLSLAPEDIVSISHVSQQLFLGQTLVIGLVPGPV